MSKYSELTNKLARQVIALRELKAERDRLQQQWSESDKAWLAARQEAQQVKAERDRLREVATRIQQMVDAQALDEGLWFIAETAAEAYLQQELRRLHATIEGKQPEGE